MSKKVVAVAAVLLAGLMACAKAAPHATTTSQGVQGGKGNGSLNSPSTGSSDDPSAAGGDDDDGGAGGGGDGGHHHHGDGGADGGEGTTPAAPTPQTCDTLAAASQTPAGKLQVTASHNITPIDVYATQDADALTIVLTQTANECGYRTNNLAHQSLGEVQIITPTPQGGFVPGSFEPQEIFSQQGTECTPANDDGDDDGNSFQDSGAQGTLTITAIDATSVTGTMDVTDFRGHQTTFTFTAPICPEVSQDQLDGATCCAQ